MRTAEHRDAALLAILPFSWQGNRHIRHHEGGRTVDVHRPHGAAPDAGLEFAVATTCPAQREMVSRALPDWRGMNGATST